MMTLKHFIELADAIRCNRSDFSDAAIKALGQFCAQQNYNFNYQRRIGYIEGQCTAHGGKIKC